MESHIYGCVSKSETHLLYKEKYVSPVSHKWDTNVNQFKKKVLIINIKYIIKSKVYNKI